MKTGIGKEIEDFERKLESSGKTLKEFSEKNLWLGVFFALVTAALMLFLGREFVETFLASIAAAVSVFIFLAALELHRFESSKRLKEELAADFLLEASLMPKGSSFEQIIKKASPRFGILGKEFARMHEMIEKGASVSESLQEFKKRNQSGCN